MTYTPAERARYVSLRVEEAQAVVREALREAAKMNGAGDELWARLQGTLDFLADARTEADDIHERGGP